MEVLVELTVAKSWNSNKKFSGLAAQHTKDGQLLVKGVKRGSYGWLL